MRKLLTAVIVLSLIAVSMPAFATRAEDLQKRYAELSQQRIKINEELLRIEGAFSELQRIEAEKKAKDKALQDKIDAAPSGSLTQEEFNIKMKDIEAEAKEIETPIKVIDFREYKGEIPADEIK